MALGFGRKKTGDDVASPDVPSGATTPDVDAAPVASHAPSSPVETDAFDFAEFDNSQTASNSQTALNSQAASKTSEPSAPTSISSSGPAFDFPEPDDSVHNATTLNAPVTDDEDIIDFDKLYAIEQQNAAQSVTRDVAPAPFVPLTATVQESSTPFYEPQVPVETATQPKKKLPLVPILGALAVLSLAGGAASHFASQSSEEVQSAPIAVRSTVRVLKRPSVGASIGAPAQKGAPVAVSRPAGLSGTSAVSPGIAPVGAQKAQLKALWKRGADAKHRGDTAGARRYWSQGLKIEPTNLGFQQSIAKLPK